jgi:tetratricopeptide (TPR) repeat protein
VRTAARRFLAPILLLAISGCASTAALERRWIEVSSPNFSIYTSLDDQQGRDLMEDLELFRAALISVTRLKDTRPRIPTDIYAFASTHEYAPFRPSKTIPGYFVPGLRGNWVAMDMGDSPSLARAILYHELTHFLVRNEGRAAVPKWFDEGFAEVLGSVDVLGAMVRIGAVPRHRAAWLVYGPRIPYDKIIRARSFNGWYRHEVGAFYAQSWLLAHLLTLGQGGKFTPRLDRYLAEVDRGVDPVDAFETAFDIDVGDLEERMTEYVKEIPTFGLPRRDLTKGLQVSVRPVPLDEIGERLGWLAMGIGRHSLAKALFERASAANPNNARAIAGLGDVEKLDGSWEEAETAYRRSLELAPDDWQNHLEFAEYFTDRAMKEEEGRDERLARAREHFAKAIELEPSNPEAHAMLGVTYTIGKQPTEPGIAALERAAKLLPSHSGIEFPLAKLHHRAGHREQAIELLRRVVYRPHGDVNREATELLEHLEKEAAKSGAAKS